MIIKVRVKIEFEVEYPLDTEFYETENEAELFAKEKALIAGQPDTIVALFRDTGKTTVTVNKVKE